MRHCGTIAGIELESDFDFIIYGHNLGVLAECTDLAGAKQALLEKIAQSNECNVRSDLAIYRWADEKWAPAISLYEMQEWEIEKNPSRVIQFP